MSRGNLYLFGPPRFELDGREVHFQQRKDFALFIYLAVTGQPHHRDALATLFWPESGQQESRASLRRSLHRLRAASETDLLELASDTIRLNPNAGLWLDVEVFKRAVAECLPASHVAGELPTGCEARLAEAAALYQGDFLAGFTLRDCPAFDDWQFFESDGLRQSLAAILVQLAYLYEARGEFEPAIQSARRWSALDPFNEPAHRLLMSLYARSGQQAAALRQYELCVQILQEQLGLDPEEETVELYESIKSRAIGSLRPEPSPARRAREQALPFFSTAFVGRQAELGELQRLLAGPECRLLTLIGPGGMGKTRLAVQAAAGLASREAHPYPDGIAFIPLMSLSTVVEVVQAVANTMKFTLSAMDEPPRRQLLNFLRAKSALLILDNFEHLLDEDSVGWIIELLAAAPGITLLVTSRTRLNVQGEQLFPVAAMGIPDLAELNHGQNAVQLAITYSSIQLFLDRARRVSPDFQLDRQNLPAVVRICQLVQGMPLGVELAAAWIEVLSPQEIAAEIEKSLDFLEVDWRDLPQRQRSLRAVFTASWNVLTPAEREIFQKLTVFRGGFTPQAARQVSGASFKVLLTLTNKSWLQREDGGRCQMHELLRQYASEAFQSRPDEWQLAQDRHSAYFAGYLQQRGEEMKGPGQRQAFAVVAVEYPNLRAAWLHLLDRKQYDTLTAMLYGLFTYFRIGNRATEMEALVAATLQAASPDVEREDCRLLVASILTARLWYSFFHIHMYDWERKDIQQAWDLAGDLGEQPALGFWMVVLAAKYARLTGAAEGFQRLLRFADYYREKQEGWLLAFTLASLGSLLLESDQDQARQLLLEALHLYREIGEYIEWATTLRMLGELAGKQHSYQEAIAYLQEALQVAGKAGDAFGQGAILWDLGQVFLYCGEFEKAFQTYERQVQIANQAGEDYIEVFALSTYSFEAVRYGDMQEAKEKRRQSLALSQELDYANGLAWGAWELGEIHRVEGDYPTARRLYEQARQRFIQIQVSLGLSFYHRGLGWIALSEGDYGEAEHHFEESLRVARNQKHAWCAAYALSGLGQAAAGLGQLETARQRLHEAVAIADSLGNPGLVMVSLAGRAALFAAAGDHQQAVQLSAFVLGHYAAWRETRTQAAQILKRSAAHLPAGVAGAAEEAGRAMGYRSALNEFGRMCIRQ